MKAYYDIIQLRKCSRVSKNVSLTYYLRSDGDKLITGCTLWEGVMSLVNDIELWQESMLLSTDECEEVETPTENAFVVVIAEMVPSVLGFSNLTREGSNLTRGGAE